MYVDIKVCAGGMDEYAGVSCDCRSFSADYVKISVADVFYMR